MSLLAVDGVDKHFGGLAALAQVSFAVEEGVIQAVIGPNGAGKSTLFKLIAGFERPSTGRILFADRQIDALPAHRIARLGLVRTFQENTVFPDATPRDAVMLAQHRSRRRGGLQAVLRLPAAGRQRRREAARAEVILEQTGLANVADRPAATLPHGLLRRLGIAMALAAEPRLLLLDEPFAGLDPEETSHGMALVRSLRASGITILLVEHDMRAVMGISDRIAVLALGRLIAEGTPAAVRADPRVIEAYLGTPDTALDA